MPISGLVVAFDAGLGPHDDAIAQLAAHPSIDVGETNANRLAIVVESNSKEHDQEIWQWIQSLPGVIDINVAFVGFDDDEENEENEEDKEAVS
jgi:nitrate reductase NapAB chaperone NapD